MSDRATIYAPGKLVLVGEYAVVDGAPAVVLAIDRGVRCDLHLGGTERIVHTPDGDTRFVDPALQHAGPGTYTFSAWNPVDLPGKPGFGGSAAACVAACVAAGRPPEDALTIHHSVQGSGSGVDVLASIHGGMGRARNKRWTAMDPVVPVVTFTGASAKTGPRVEAYRAWSSRRSFIDDSTAIVDAFATDPHTAFRAAWRLLSHMARAAGVAYRTPAIDHIVQVAESFGGAAKPSGAGGGDCTVALFPDAERAAAFTERVAADGFPGIAVSPAPGARRVDT